MAALFLLESEVTLIEIKIPKEVRDYHETIFFGLNTRQFICSLLALGVAVGVYFCSIRCWEQRKSAGSASWPPRPSRLADSSPTTV